MEEINVHFKLMVVAGAWIVAAVLALLKISAEFFGWGLGWEATFNGLAIIPLVYIFAAHSRGFWRAKRKTGA